MSKPDLDSIKLDRDRDFAEVRPPGPCFFLQDGIYFDNDGNVVESELDDAGMARLDRLIKEREATEAADKARREKLIELGIDPDESDLKPMANGSPVVTSETRGIDLVSWAKGEQKHKWPHVQQAFRTQHSKIVTSKDDALDFLVEKGLVSKDDIKA